MSNLTLQSTVRELYQDPKFNELMLAEITEIRAQVRQNKKTKAGVVLFLEKFTMDEIKSQYLRVAEKTAYLTAIQKQLIMHIVRNSIIKTLEFNALHESSKGELERSKEEESV